MIFGQSDSTFRIMLSEQSNWQCIVHCIHRFTAKPLHRNTTSRCNSLNFQQMMVEWNRALT